jgi:plasmid stabilization system protein ParE
VASLVFLPSALRDLERLARFLRETDPDAAAETGSLILDSLRILKNFPLVGRRADDTKRELTIFRGSTGYLALYHFDSTADRVMVLAVRHQREVDFQ